MKKQINFTFDAGNCRMRDFAVCDEANLDAAKNAVSRAHRDVVVDSVVDYTPIVISSAE